MNPEVNVVIAYDFSLTAREALQRGFGVALRAPFHALHIVCVIEPHHSIPAVPPDGAIDYTYADKVEAAVVEVVTQHLRSLNIGDRAQFFVHVRFGKPADEILAVARDVGADLIIIGTHGRTGVERLVLGSVAGRVVQEAGCTVEVARAKTYDHVTRLDISDAPPHPRSTRRLHCYSYESSIALRRPSDFPLY